MSVSLESCPSWKLAASCASSLPLDRLYTPCHQAVSLISQQRVPLCQSSLLCHRSFSRYCSSCFCLVPSGDTIHCINFRRQGRARQPVSRGNQKKRLFISCSHGSVQTTTSRKVKSIWQIRSILIFFHPGKLSGMRGDETFLRSRL